MSRSTVRQKTGVIFALVALVLGVTAATALGWANGEEKSGNKQEHGDDKGDSHYNKPSHEESDRDKDKGYGNKPSPKETTPPPQAIGPQVPAAPPVVAPAAPPTSGQGSPDTPTPAQQQQGGAQTTPTRGGEENAGTESPVVAQQAPAAAPLAPVAERKELAQTGLDPGLIALLGALCLGGGAFLFRRALVRG